MTLSKGYFISIFDQTKLGKVLVLDASATAERIFSTVYEVVFSPSFIMPLMILGLLLILLRVDSIAHLLGRLGLLILIAPLAMRLYWVPIEMGFIVSDKILSPNNSYLKRWQTALVDLKGRNLINDKVVNSKKRGNSNQPFSLSSQASDFSTKFLSSAVTYSIDVVYKYISYFGANLALFFVSITYSLSLYLCLCTSLFSLSISILGITKNAWQSLFRDSIFHALLPSVMAIILEFLSDIADIKSLHNVNRIEQFILIIISIVILLKSFQKVQSLMSAGGSGAVVSSLANGLTYAVFNGMTLSGASLLKKHMVDRPFNRILGKLRSGKKSGENSANTMTMNLQDQESTSPISPLPSAQFSDSGAGKTTKMPTNESMQHYFSSPVNNSNLSQNSVGPLPLSAPSKSQNQSTQSTDFQKVRNHADKTRSLSSSPNNANEGDKTINQNKSKWSIPSKNFKGEESRSTHIGTTNVEPKNRSSSEVISEKAKGFDENKRDIGETKDLPQTKKIQPKKKILKSYLKKSRENKGE